MRKPAGSSEIRQDVPPLLIAADLLAGDLRQALDAINHTG